MSDQQRKVKKFQAGDEVVIPSDNVVEVDPKIARALVKPKVKREMSEKQRENIEKLVAMNREKWARAKEQNTLPPERLRTKAIAEDMKAIANDKLSAQIKNGVEQGDLIKLKVAESKVSKPRTVSYAPIDEKEEERFDVAGSMKAMMERFERLEKMYTQPPPTPAPVAPKQRKARGKAYEDSTDYSDSESDTEVIRKKTAARLQQLKKIESVIQTVAPNRPRLSVFS